MKNIQNDINAGSFKQIYLLYGEERYLKRQYADRLRKAMCQDDDQMNIHFYDGKESSVGEVIDLAETLPFLAERRVIFWNNSGLFKSGGEALAEYLAAPCETTCFVFTESEVDKRSKLYKTAQSTGRTVEFSKQDEQTLKRWIAGILGRENKKITDRTAQYFLEKTGTDMENIQMELEKLICYAYDREVITVEDVDAICTNRISSHIFDMIDAIADGRQKEALQLYYDLLSLKEPPMRILFLIARHCNLLLQVKEMRSKGYNNKIIASAADIPSFFVGKYASQASRFKTAALRSAVEQCVNAEADVKSGRLDDMLSVEILIMSVLKAE